MTIFDKIIDIIVRRQQRTFGRYVSAVVDGNQAEADKHYEIGRVCGELINQINEVVKEHEEYRDFELPEQFQERTMERFVKVE